MKNFFPHVGQGIPWPLGGTLHMCIRAMFGTWLEFGSKIAILWTQLHWSEGLTRMPNFCHISNLIELIWGFAQNTTSPLFLTRLNWSDEGLLTMLLFPPPRGWFAFLSCKITLQYLMSTMWLLQMQTMRWFGKVSCRGEYWGRWNQCSALK